MSNISFDWDEEKNLLNQKKHDISFAEASTVFYDENAIEYYDDHHSTYEERFLLLGRSFKLRILLIVFCLRKKDTQIRIISARRATKKEKLNFEVEK